MWILRVCLGACARRSSNAQRCLQFAWVARRCGNALMSVKREVGRADANSEPGCRAENSRFGFARFPAFDHAEGRPRVSQCGHRSCPCRTFQSGSTSRFTLSIYHGFFNQCFQDGPVQRRRPDSWFRFHFARLSLSRRCLDLLLHHALRLLRASPLPPFQGRTRVVPSQVPRLPHHLSGNR